jgi:transcriptional regulator with XRE-family HTH domain
MSYYKVFDVNSFLGRSGMIFEDLAKKIDCSTGLIGMWTSGKSFASFDKCLKLLELGMTVEEMLGTELFKKIALSPEVPENEKESEGDFRNKVGEAFIELLNGGFFKLKKES